MSKADISINVSNVRQADIKMCNSYTSLNYFIFEISKLFYVVERVPVLSLIFSNSINWFPMYCYLIFNLVIKWLFKTDLHTLVVYENLMIAKSHTTTKINRINQIVIRLCDYVEENIYPLMMYVCYPNVIFP